MLFRILIRVAGGALIFTGIAKLISSAGDAHILQYGDPVLMVSVRNLFLFAGGLELLVGIYCLFGSRLWLQAGFIAWLATMFVAYRVGLWWLHVPAPCPCLGSITAALHLSTKLADTTMKWVLAYLLVVGYGTLMSRWLVRN